MGTYHDPVLVVVLVGSDLRPYREALEAEVKVGALGAFDAHAARDVLLAVVAVVQRLSHLA